MEINPEKSNSRESLSVDIENFEKNLTTYRNIVSKETDIFKTIKNHSEDFMRIVDQLIIDSHEIKTKINDSEQVKEMSYDKVEHYKIIFNHYDTYFVIQKKTAETFLQLESNKNEGRKTNIAHLRERFHITETAESKPKM